MDALHCCRQQRNSQFVEGRPGVSQGGQTLAPKVWVCVCVREIHKSKTETNARLHALSYEAQQIFSERGDGRECESRRRGCFEP